MSILTGKQIIEEINSGNIEIEPFDINRINPNSYNMRIGDRLKVYRPADPSTDMILDTRRTTNVAIDEFTIPEDGFILRPGILYLGETVERTFSRKFIPIIDGRSSGGRLGIQIHMTAGFGDLGFNGIWTLEITVVHPVRIYPNDELCQVYFETPFGDYSYQYDGRYQNQTRATESRIAQSKRGLITDVR